MKSSTVKLRLIGALLFFVLTGSSVLAQVQTAKYISINSNTHAFYEYLPQGYSSGGNYPLIIFLHGLGELGAGNSSTLPPVANNGIPRLIRDGKFPTSFKVQGVDYKFIVLSPQFVAWPKSTDVNAVIEYAVRTYKVDQSRIYITGLSMGGGATWSTAADANVNQKLAAIVPVCGAVFPATFRANAVADGTMAIWATHNDGDPTVPLSYTNDFYTLIKARRPNAIIKKTIFNAGGHDAWTKTYDPNFRENGMNVYEWMLQYTNGTTVPPPANQAPTADAGGDKNLTLPTNSVQLIGRGTDADGTIASYAWTKVSGPATGNISSATVSNPTLTNLAEGTYVYQLKVTDNKGASATSQARIVVSAATNQAPAADAGGNKYLTLPTNSVQLSGRGTDADGTIASYAWTKISGPSSGSISSTTVSNPTLSGLVAGTYVYQLTVTDNRGAQASNQASIVVSAAANQAPSANAGADRIVTQPATSTTLSGSGADPDGSIASYAWTKVSGPSGGTISSPAAASTSVTALVVGTYVFQLRVTDNKGASASDQVTVVVNASTPGGGPTTPKYVRVNLYDGNNPYNSSQWNNWDIATAAGNAASVRITSSPFKYSDGTASTIKGYLSHSQQVKDNGAGYGAGMAPSEVLRTASYSSIGRTLTVQGLSTSKKYTLELYSSRNVSGFFTTFKVNGRSLQVNTYNNFTNAVSFADLTPNAKGEIVVEIQKSNLFNYLNGFTVVETSGTSSGRVAASSTADEKVATGTEDGITEEEGLLAGKLGFETYPNPVVNQLQVKLSNPHTGQLVVKVFDRTGALRQEVRTTKNQDVMQVLVPFEKLGTGTYFIRCTIGDWTETKQVVKFK